MKRKHLLYVCLFFLPILGFQACNREYEPFPDAPVSLALNLTSHYIDFKAPLQYRTFEKIDEYAGAYRIGYGGILVNISIESEYCAYDMTCTYEKDPSVKVYPDSLGLHAVCEKCGSSFDLAYGFGMLEKGPATQHLKRYHTSLITGQGADILRVFN